MDLSGDLMRFGSLLTFMDGVVLKDSAKVDDIDFGEGFKENREFTHVYRNLNVKGFGDFMRDPSEHGAYNYARIYQVAEDLLSMFEAMHETPFCVHRTDGDKNILNWKEIFDVIFDEEKIQQFLSLTMHVKTVTLNIVMDRFKEILGKNMCSVFAMEIWNKILIHTLHGKNGCRNFQMHTVLNDGSSRDEELRLLSKVMKSMGHMHILLSRIAFFSCYVNLDNAALHHMEVQTVRSSDVALHFNFRLQILKRDVSQLFFHISQDTERYLPKNVCHNVMSIWKGLNVTSAFCVPDHPQSVCFCEGLTSLAAIVNRDCFWDDYNFSHGTVTVCDLESGKVFMRILVENRMLRDSWHVGSFHLSPRELVFVGPMGDNDDPRMKLWKFDTSQNDAEKFLHDLEFRLGPNNIFSFEGHLAFFQHEGAGMIAICTHSRYAGPQFSRLYVIRSSTGEKLLSFEFPGTKFEILGIQNGHMLLSDNSDRDVVFRHIADDNQEPWRQRCTPLDKEVIGGLMARFDVDPKNAQFVILKLDDGGCGVCYELFSYTTEKGSKPQRIFNGFFPMFLKSLRSSSMQLLNGIVYLLAENLNVSYCHCYRRKAVIGYDVVLMNCHDSGIHPVDSLAGDEVFVALSELTPCIREDCKGRILIDDANPRFILGFSTERARKIHLATKNKLYVDSSSFDLSMSKGQHFITFTFK